MLASPFDIESILHSNHARRWWFQQKPNLCKCGGVFFNVFSIYRWRVYLFTGNGCLTLGRNCRRSDACDEGLDNLRTRSQFETIQPSLSEKYEFNKLVFRMPSRENVTCYTALRQGLTGFWPFFPQPVYSLKFLKCTLRHCNIQNKNSLWRMTTTPDFFSPVYNGQSCCISSGQCQVDTSPGLAHIWSCPPPEPRCLELYPSPLYGYYQTSSDQCLRERLQSTCTKHIVSRINLWRKRELSGPPAVRGKFPQILHVFGCSWFWCRLGIVGNSLERFVRRYTSQ